MSASEFDLIRRYFAPSGKARADVLLGVGDDGAVLRPPAGRDLVAAIDTLVSGVHFPGDTDPASIGHKALAVNLSDLAAMGAEPAWAMLALTLPQADERWLAEFARGFFALARSCGVDLVGGDTTRGPLTVSVQVQGFVAPGEAFRRGGARPGDLIYVTGALGDAGLALLLLASEPGGPLAEERAYLRGRLDRPQPRISEALRLRGLVHAAIDVSDGLLADLGHVLEASGVGATLALERLPLSPAFRACLETLGADHPVLRQCTPGLAWADLALTAGDDYELCFTVDPAHRSRLEVLTAAGLACSCVGTVDAEAGLRCRLADGTLYTPPRHGYDHFAGAAT